MNKSSSLLTTSSIWNFSDAITVELKWHIDTIIKIEKCKSVSVSSS